MFCFSRQYSFNVNFNRFEREEENSPLFMSLLLSSIFFISFVSLTYATLLSPKACEFMIPGLSVNVPTYCSPQVNWSQTQKENKNCSVIFILKRNSRVLRNRLCQIVYWYMHKLQIYFRGKLERWLRVSGSQTWGYVHQNHAEDLLKHRLLLPSLIPSFWLNSPGVQVFTLLMGVQGMLM